MLNLHTKEIAGKEKIFQIDLKGILDFETSESFIHFIEEKINSGINRFIINCKNLSYITSSGISSLIKLNIELKETKTALVYSELNAEVKLLFSLFGFDKKYLVAEDNTSAEKILQNLFLPDTNEKIEDKKEFSKFKNIEFSFDNKINKDPIDNHSATTEKTILENRQSNLTIPIIQVEATEWIKISREDRPQNSISLSLQEKIKQLQESSARIEETKADNLISTEKIDVLQQNMEQLDEEPELISLSDNSIISSITPHSNFHESVFHCESCGKPIRIVKPGKHKCPVCDSIFSVRPGGSVSYLEKLI